MKNLPTILAGCLCACVPATAVWVAPAVDATIRQALPTKPAGAASPNGAVGEISAALSGVRSDTPAFGGLAIGLMLMGRQMRRRSGPRIVPS